MIKALQESSIERIPELFVLPADDPYFVLKRRLIELYDLNNYKRAELLMVLPQVDGDMRPSMLLDKMRALTPPGELERPTSLFWHAFLMRLLSDINVNCVLFLGVETLADVARRADTQFGARPSLLRCHRSTAFPRSRASMVTRSLRPSRMRSMPEGQGQELDPAATALLLLRPLWLRCP